VTLADLPGGDLVVAGLDDLARGADRDEQRGGGLVAPRLRRLGFEVRDDVADPERRLYELLARDDADTAHGRYNALVRRLVSFERAAESLAWR
jgi:hypothetical protein